MQQANLTPVQRQLLAQFAGNMVESGCDAVVVIGTSTKNNRTKSFVAQFGNELLCNSLIHHAFQTETLVYAEIEEDSDD
jgi:riboflavin synthase